MLLNSRDIAVSVVVTTYNHRDYLEACLESILSQRTDFPFEVIVHDDASTDGTSDIVRRYAEQYSTSVIPIIQSTNLLSKHESPSPYIFSKTSGKYIATCEGDDYWSERDKLQKQFDFMEENSKYSLCMHNAIVNDFFLELDYLTEPNSIDRDKSCETIILEGGGLINPTASFFYRKDKRFPEWGVSAPVGDHFLMMRLASRGKVRWMASPMSVYRFGAKGSYSARNHVRDVDATRRYSDLYVQALMEYDRLTGGDYHEAFGSRIELQKREEFIAVRQAMMAEAIASGGPFASCDAPIPARIKECARRYAPEQALRILLRAKKIYATKRAGTYVASCNQTYLD